MQPIGCLRNSACRSKRSGGMAGRGWCSQLRASSELQLVSFGRCGGTRDARSTVAESLIALYRVGTHQIWRRRSASRSSTSQGSTAPLCARFKGANREVSEGKADHGLLFSYEGHEKRRTGKIRGAFSRMHRSLDGWMLTRARASPAQGLHHHGPRYFNFPYFCTMCGLEKLGLVDQN